MNNPKLGKYWHAVCDRTGHRIETVRGTSDTAVVDPDDQSLFISTWSPPPDGQITSEDLDTEGSHRLTTQTLIITEGSASAMLDGLIEEQRQRAAISNKLYHAWGILPITVLALCLAALYFLLPMDFHVLYVLIPVSIVGFASAVAMSNAGTPRRVLQRRMKAPILDEISDEELSAHGEFYRISSKDADLDLHFVQPIDNKTAAIIAEWREKHDRESSAKRTVELLKRISKENKKFADDLIEAQEITRSLQAENHEKIVHHDVDEALTAIRKEGNRVH